MKKLITCFFLFSTLIFSQTYLSITFTSDPASCTNLSLIQKITFSGTDATFLLTDNSSVPKGMSTINKMTFSSTDCENPLPVELSNFTAAVNGNEVILRWRTATEVDNYGFEIERSLTPTSRNEFGTGSSQREGAFNWEKIGFVNGHGNSNSPKQYEFVDIPKGGTAFQYRLKQIDSNGKYTYGNVVSVEIGIPSQYALRQNYPNPFNPSTKIAYSIPKNGLVFLEVYDVLGNEVALLVNSNQEAGNYEVIYDGSRQASGIYICKMSSGDYTSSIKMLILK